MRKDYRHIVFSELPAFVRSAVNQTLEREGGFVDHEADYETNFGIRRLSADSAGYYGRIEDIDKDTAARIWAALEWYGPKISLLAEVSPLIGQSVFDTAGPAGHIVAIKHLQRALTFFNAAYNGRLIYGDDLIIDGVIGQKTIAQLKRYLKHRKTDHGERKLATLLNSLQAVHFVEVAERNIAKRVFAYGWVSGRVFADLRDLTPTGTTFA